jgi:hypothetical protein
MAGLEVRSSAFNDEDLMPDRLSRRGGNHSPPLMWSGPVESATELVVYCEDPDAATPPLLHWLVTGIRPDVSSLPEGEIPPGARQWPNSFGETGYTGPDPPKGDDPHRYFFRVYAVNGPLRLPAQPTTTDLRRELEAHKVVSGVIVGTFGR